MLGGPILADHAHQLHRRRSSWPRRKRTRPSRPARRRASRWAFRHYPRPRNQQPEATCGMTLKKVRTKTCPLSTSTTAAIMPPIAVPARVPRAERAAGLACGGTVAHPASLPVGGFTIAGYHLDVGNTVSMHRVLAGLAPLAVDCRREIATLRRLPGPAKEDHSDGQTLFCVGGVGGRSFCASVRSRCRRRRPRRSARRSTPSQPGTSAARQSRWPTSPTATGRRGVPGHRVPAGQTLCPAAGGTGRRVGGPRRGLRGHRLEPAGFDHRAGALRPASTRSRSPLLKDVNNVIADQFGAIRTPEMFVLDADRVVRYWGRVDDQFGFQGNGIAYQRNEPQAPRSGRLPWTSCWPASR